MSLNTIFDNGTHQIRTAGSIKKVEPKSLISKLAFKQRMTPAERIAIRVAAKADPVIFDFMDLVSDAKYIDLKLQDTIDGVNYLESNGHIAQGRASEILSTTIPKEERP